MPQDHPLQPHKYDPELYHAAAERRRMQRIEDDVLTDSVEFACSQSPDDGLAVLRSGPRGGVSSFVSLMTVEGPSCAVVGLTARDARRLAATLIDFADQIDSPADQISRLGEFA